MALTVTIGVPVRNGQEFLRQAIESALAQTFRDFEVLISDNASEDGTEAICREFVSGDQRVRYVRQPHNIGAIRNFLFLADHAEGQLFTLLAHDDLLDANYVETMLPHLRDRRTVLVAPDFRVVDGDGAPLRVERLLGIRGDIAWEVRAVRFFEHPITNAFFCIYGLARTDAMRLGLASIAERRDALEIELPLLSRIAVEGEIASVPVVLRTYRWGHPSSYSHTMSSEVLTRSLLGRNMDRARVRWRSRKEQLGVLFALRLPLRARLSILLKVLGSYAAFFVLQSRSAPRKVFRVLRGR